MQNPILQINSCKVIISQGKEFLAIFPQISKLVGQKVKRQSNKNKKKTARKFIQGIYIGPVNSNALPHSASSTEEGIFLYDSGFYYQGQMKNGKRQGSGILVNEDGEYYEGQWSNNNPNGQGKYVSSESSRSYEGQWLQGIQNGKGTEKYEDQSSYEGDFTNGVKHGRGILKYPDGTYYEGQFKDNSIKGIGKCSGKFHKYEGQWDNGKMNGNGISIWNDENGQVIGSYLGQYKSGLKHGYGQYRWGDTKIYKGKWEEGDMSSEGVLLNYQK